MEMTKNVPVSQAATVTRRDFAKMGAAAAMAGAVAGSFEIVHPEGAIAEDAPEEVRYTYCDMCNHVPKCGIAATVKDGKVVRVAAREAYPADPICAKGIGSLQELYDPERITTPMVRTNPKGTGDPQWEPISWEDAYARIASEFNRVKDEYGPEKVLFYCGDPKEPRGAMSASRPCSARATTAPRARPAPRLRGSRRSSCSASSRWAPTPPTPRRAPWRGRSTPLGRSPTASAT